MPTEESRPRGVATETLARLIHDHFEVRSIEVGWAEGDLTPWETNHAGLTPGYREALRLTAEDILASEWFFEVVKEAAAETLDAAVERWKLKRGVPPGSITVGTGTLSADSYVPQMSVVAFLRTFMNEIEKEKWNG